MKFKELFLSLLVVAAVSGCGGGYAEGENPIGGLNLSSATSNTSESSKSSSAALSQSSTLISAAYSSASEVNLSASSVSSTTVEPISQSFSFAQVGPLVLLAGDVLTNQAEGQGNGAVVYSSNNNAVATVDSGSGQVDFVAPGNVVITANIAADAHYLAAEASYSITASLASQTLSFTQSGQIDLPLGGSLVNQAMGQGTGGATYSSSDTNVATVDSSGLVTVVGVGRAVITANKAEDTRYLSAMASYTVNVGVAITAWVGSQDTLVNFPTEMNGFEFYRSSESNCDFTNYLNCLDGQMSVLTGSVVTDTAATLARAGYYVLKNGSHPLTLDLELNTSAQLKSTNKVVVYKNKLWLLNPNGKFSYDLRSSIDGINWSEESTSISLINQYGSAFEHSSADLLVLNNQLWLFGVISNGTHLYDRDVWSSNDGKIWNYHGLIPTSYRFSSKNIVFNNMLWIIGGEYSWPNSFFNDIWSSLDGFSWIQRASSSQFSGRSTHEVVEHNGKLYLVGGTSFTGKKNDVWSSADGVSWTLLTANASFSPRSGHQVLSFANKLWLLGGNDGVSKKDVWTSVDGISWVQVNSNTPFSVNFNSVVFNSALMVVSGSPDESSGVWSSDNGIEWRKGISGIFQPSQ
ncbi:MAG: Ig-like domain-containing protein [Pseudomonadota bacterium]